MNDNHVELYFEDNDELSDMSMEGLITINDIKPYLRSMSSMTEEETLKFVKTTIKTPDGYPMWATDSYDWLNKHHFDYRGLIPMRVALEAPEGMYN